MKFATIISILVFTCLVTTSAQRPIPAGLWGGNGIQLTVTANGGVIEYGCDSGTINGRLRADSRGKFSAVGTHVFGSGGPRNQGDPQSRARQARYEGVRTGDKLEIAVFLPELNRSFGKFTLRRGRAATLERCG